MITGVVYAIVDKRDPDKVLYVGSTIDMKQRWSSHKSRAGKEKYRSRRKYIHIQENGGIQNFAHFPLFTGYFRDKEHLRKTEEKYRKMHKAPLNMHVCHKNEQCKKEEARVRSQIYRKENREEQRAKAGGVITCECGVKISRSVIARHRRESAKHRRIMEVKAVLEDILTQVSSLWSLGVLL